MSEEKDKKVNNSTRIDLGEDLLLGTEFSIKSAESILSEENPKELLRSAKILKSEGLIQEAKKVFFAVLRLDPKNTQAKKLLEEIQEYEFKELFRDEFESSRNEKYDENIDSEEIVKNLENDLKLNLEDHLKNSEIDAQIDIQKAQIQDLYDISILFYNLEKYNKSIEFLNKLLLKNTESEEELLLRISGVELLASIYVEQKKYFDAIQLLEKELLENRELNFDRIQFYYLLAVSFFHLKQFDRAEFYVNETLSKRKSFKNAKELHSKIMGRLKSKGRKN